MVTEVRAGSAILLDDGVPVGDRSHDEGKASLAGFAGSLDTDTSDRLLWSKAATLGELTREVLPEVVLVVVPGLSLTKVSEVIDIGTVSISLLLAMLARNLL